jgi:hypothetical protein
LPWKPFQVSAATLLWLEKAHHELFVLLNTCWRIFTRRDVSDLLSVCCAVYATDTGDGILNEFPNVPRGCAARFHIISTIIAELCSFSMQTLPTSADCELVSAAIDSFHRRHSQPHSSAVFSGRFFSQKHPQPLSKPRQNSNRMMGLVDRPSICVTDWTACTWNAADMAALGSAASSELVGCTSTLSSSLSTTPGPSPSSESTLMQ